jgi:hypothetical protein
MKTKADRLPRKYSQFGLFLVLSVSCKLTTAIHADQNLVNVPGCQPFPTRETATTTWFLQLWAGQKEKEGSLENAALTRKQVKEEEEEEEEEE